MQTRRLRERRARVTPIAPFAAIALSLSLSATVRAEAPQTWGVEPSASPARPAYPALNRSLPPDPPPASVGEPLPGSVVDGGAPRTSAVTPADADPIVFDGEKIGLRYTLEGIEVRGNATTLSRVVLRYLPFRQGDTLDVNDPELERSRFRLLGTGFFRDVRLSLRKGSRRHYVILVVSVAERNTIVINDLWLGLSADAEPNGRARPLTAYGGAHVSENNIAGTGSALGGAFAVADRQLALRARFADRDLLRSGYSLESELLYSQARDFFGNRDVLVDDPSEQAAQDFAVMSYRRFGGSIGVGHDLGSATHLLVGYRLETVDASPPRAASHHRGPDVEPIRFMLHDGASVLSSLRATLVYDTRDEPILPTRGRHIVLQADASLTPLGSEYPYTKFGFRGSQWHKLDWGHVIRVEGFVGALFGDAPLFEKYYVGDFSDFLPDRVLDLNFDRRPAPNFLSTSIVETRQADYAAKLQIEYRVPLYRGTRAIYGVDAFASFGLYALAEARDFSEPSRGYTGARSLPIDLTFNGGLRVSTSAGGILFGLSNFVGLAPVRGPDQGVR